MAAVRGTNPCLYYCLPFGPEMVAKAALTVHFENKMLLAKTLPDMYWQENNMLCMPLTRQETLCLPDDSRVQLQLQIETTDGDSLVAAPQWLYTGVLLDEEALQ